MATVVHPHVETWEFDALQEDTGWSMGVELIAGEAVFVLPIGPFASCAQIALSSALGRWQEDVGDGGLLMIEVFVALPNGSRVGPDIAWWSAEHYPPLGRGAVQAVPDLVVEVLSPSTRANDLGVKRELYMASGVRELWLVDPDARTIMRVRPDSESHEVLDESQVLRSELLPGFALEVARVFPFDPDSVDEGS